MDVLKVRVLSAVCPMETNTEELWGCSNLKKKKLLSGKKTAKLWISNPNSLDQA